jgi:tubulin---tyrosine ligase
LPNAFELFGADLLVTYDTPLVGMSPFKVHLLELNAEPAIHLTGPRLEWILEELFEATKETCIVPFFSGTHAHIAQKQRGNDSPRLRKCLDIQIRGENSW